MKKLICAAVVAGALLSPSSALASVEWSALRHDLFAFEWRFNPAHTPARIGRDLVNFRGFSLHGTTGNLAFAAFGAVDDPHKSYSVKLAQVALAVGGAALAATALSNGRDKPRAAQSATPTARALSAEEVAELMENENTPPELKVALAQAFEAVGQSHTRECSSDSADTSSPCYAFSEALQSQVDTPTNLDSGGYNAPAVTAQTSAGRTTYTIRYPLRNVERQQCTDQANCDNFEAYDAEEQMVQTVVRHCGSPSNPQMFCSSDADREAAMVYLNCELGRISRGSCSSSTADRNNAKSTLATRLSPHQTPIDEYWALRSLFEPDTATVMVEKWKTSEGRDQNGNTEHGYNYGHGGRGPRGDAVSTVTFSCLRASCDTVPAGLTRYQ